MLRVSLSGLCHQQKGMMMTGGFSASSIAMPKVAPSLGNRGR